MDTTEKLNDWFIERYEEFEDEVPHPNKITRVIDKVLEYFQTTLIKYLGSGDNGIVFLTDDNNILKFTIDEREAILWNRIKSKQIPGITNLKEVVNISSSVTGDTLIYVVKAEYAPEPVTPQQKELIQQAQLEIKRKNEELRNRLRSSGKTITNEYVMGRTLNIIQTYEKIADTDESFANIPEMLINIADKYSGFLYDLQPNNFRLNSEKMVVLVDPSVPDLTGNIAKPTELMYEEKISLIMNSKIMYIT